MVEEEMAITVVGYNVYYLVLLHVPVYSVMWKTWLLAQVM